MIDECTATCFDDSVKYTQHASYDGVHRHELRFANGQMFIGTGDTPDQARRIAEDVAHAAGLMPWIDRAKEEREAKAESERIRLNFCRGLDGRGRSLRDWLW